MVASSCCCVARWLATSMASEAAIASASRFRPSTRVSSWRRSSDLLRASAKDSARSTSAGFRPEGDQQQLNQGRRWSYPRSAHGHLLRGHSQRPATHPATTAGTQRLACRSTVAVVVSPQPPTASGEWPPLPAYPPTSGSSTSCRRACPSIIGLAATP